MLALSHRCEFMSDAWLEHARKYLGQQVQMRAEKLGRRPFSVSERFTDAPPHLQLPENVGAWTVRFDGQGVDVRRGFDETADVTVQGDYQAALTMAQVIGARVPEVMAAGWELTTRMYGQGAIEAKGRLEDPAAADLMAGLHDHLGRMTVENPDLAHRARRQGLVGKIREMEENGYVILENAISPELADEIRAASLKIMLPQNEHHMHFVLHHGRVFEDLIQHPQLMTLVDASLGRGATIGSFTIQRKGPGKGAIPLHTDYTHVPEPYPEFAMAGVAVWALEDWTEASGPTWIIPGSHKLRRGPRPGEGQNGGVPAVMPKGSVVFFTHGAWHWQGDRSEPGDRITLHSHYMRGILRSLEPFKIDVNMLHRNPPRLGELLGEDDFFGKIDANGRDYERFGYMARLQQFSDAAKARLLAEEVG